MHKIWSRSRAFFAAVFVAAMVATATGTRSVVLPVMTPLALVSAGAEYARAKFSVVASGVRSYAASRPAPSRASWQAGFLNEKSVVSLMVVALLAAILIPIGINQMEATDTSSWSATAVTVWDNLPVIIAVALLLGFVGFFTASRRKSGN